MIQSLERVKDGAATMEWSRNGAVLSGNEAAKRSEHGKEATIGSEQRMKVATMLSRAMRRRYRESTRGCCDYL